MDKNEITDKVIELVVNNNMTTKEVHEICFAVMYHTLLNKENIKLMKEQMNIDLLKLTGKELIDFVHAINMSMVLLSDEPNK